jgi:DNA recombination protein RmuC
LTQILESSGLREGFEFQTQMVLSGDQGEALRPDAVVHLPGGRSLVIDAKVSLTAWDRYCRASDDEEKGKALKEHVASLKRHIQGLGSRRYDRAHGVESADLVFLFTRVEPAWIEALRYEPSLLMEGEKHGIAIVSPTTLFATLKIVAGLWARERQNKNALQIAEEAGKLYDKFVSFEEDLFGASKDLEKAAEKLNFARRKLSEGPGNLVGRVEKMKELGAKASRQLSKRTEEEHGGHSN